VKADATQLLPHPSWENPRVHLLDDIWLMTLAAVVFATAVPWLFSGFEVDIRGGSWGLLALGALHVAFTLLSSGHASRWRARALTALDLIGVICIGFMSAVITPNRSSGPMMRVNSSMSGLRMS